MSQLKNQRGFAVLEVIMLIVVLGILGFVGYRAYLANQAKPATQSKTTNTDPYSGWKSYNDGQYSFKYPPAWRAMTHEQAGHSVLVTNPSKTLSIAVTETTGFDYCLGNEVVTKPITITFDQRAFNTKEILCRSNQDAAPLIFFRADKNGSEYDVTINGPGSLGGHAGADYRRSKADILLVLKSFRIK